MPGDLLALVTGRHATKPLRHSKAWLDLRFFPSGSFSLMRLIVLMCASVGTYAASDTGAAEGRLLGRVGESGDRVYWACRFGACRVNIAFTNRESPASDPEKSTGIRVRTGPPTQVWLLKADGTHIPALRAIPANIGATNFEFPLSAQVEAFAVVVRIDDKLHAWWLAAAAGK